MEKLPVSEVSAWLLDYMSSSLGRLRRPIMLVGPTGVGKTDTVKQFAQRTGRELYTVHSAHVEPTDVNGLPFPNRDRQVTEFYPVSTWPIGVPNTVLFFDELNRGSVLTMNALMQVVLDWQVGVHKLPENTLIIAAVNPPGGNNQVTPMSAPMMGRFIPVHLEATTEGWIQWAAGAGIEPLVITFISRNRMLLDPLSSDDATESMKQAIAKIAPAPNPRNWHKVSDILAGYDPYSESEDDNAINAEQLHMLIQGCVGVEASGQFMNFIDNINELPEPEEVYNGSFNPSGDTVGVDVGATAIASTVAWAREQFKSDPKLKHNGNTNRVGFLSTWFSNQYNAKWSPEHVVTCCLMLRGVDEDALLGAVTAMTSTPWAKAYTEPLVDLVQQMKARPKR